MSASLLPTAPAGTPVWVQLADRVWLAGTTLAVPYHLDYGGGFHRVEVEIHGRGEHDYPISRVERRRVR